MTPTELHLRIKSVEAPDTVDSFSNGFYTLTVEELLLLCRKVQAAAWSDAAEFVFNAPRGKILGTKLRRMAEELDPTVCYAGQDPKLPIDGRKA